MNKKKIGIIILLLIIAVILLTIALTKKVANVQSITSRLFASGENTKNANSQIGEQGIISSAQIIQTKTGTGPFDSNDDAGNDSSEENNIVRSFDKITWTIDLTMSLKSGVTETNIKGGTIEIDVELPSTCANLVKWDINSMNWIQNGEISEDGTKLTGQYNMSETEITIPGKQSLSFALDIYGAGNKAEIIPTFNFKLIGNSDNEKVSLKGETIYVSATGKYNVQLIQNTSLAYKSSVDYGEGNTYGRMYGYNFAVQLYNETEEKGLKGIEYPKGEITFDIDLKLERTKSGSTQREDITDKCTPILYNYRLNDWSTSTEGYIEGREMFYEGSYHQYNQFLPLGIYVEKGKNYSTYNSGNINISQNKNKLNVSIKDYDFNGQFGRYEANYNGAADSGRDKVFGENVGAFSIGYMQIFVPDNDESTISDRKYYLTVADNNFNITSSTGDTITTQVNTSDDDISIEHILHRNGTYTQQIILTDTNYQNLESYFDEGDGKATVGQEIVIQSKFITMNNGDDDIYTANRFIKFDGDAFQPMLFHDGSKYKFVASSVIKGDPKFNIWYVTKSDGKNWTSQTEMNNANIEDENLEIYENIEDIPSDKICIGIYAELFDGYINRAIGTSGRHLTLKFKIKDTAVIGQTYAMTQNTELWIEKLDRNEYTITNPDCVYPKPDYSVKNRQYVKTEYDEKGNIIEGTPYVGFAWGQTVLVVGANLHGDISTVDESGTEKTAYDLGKNENIATFKVEPKLDKNSTLNVQIGGVSLKAQVTIPKGLRYIEQSSNYGEPETIKNTDGSTTLIWYIEGCVTGENIEAITFDTYIDNESANETKYTSIFVISEDVQNGISKIGNSEIKFRTSTTTINIVNLASHRLYKEVDTSVVENNKEITYKIVYENKTENNLPEFQLLDVLPYNGDKRGSRYSGEYTIEGIDVKQYINGQEQTNTDLKLYITNAEEVKNIDAKNEQIGSASIWIEKDIGSNISEKMTGIALKGEVKGKERIEIEITMKTNGNKSKDVYINNAMAQITKDSEQMETGKVETIVVERQLEKQIEVTTTITVSDKMSGISKVEYGWSTSNSIEPSEYINVEGTLTDPIRVNKKLAKGTHYLWVRATDGVGNINEEISKVFEIKEPETE